MNRTLRYIVPALSIAGWVGMLMSAFLAAQFDKHAAIGVGATAALGIMATLFALMMVAEGEGQ